jgi:hypothetical protein
MIAVEQLLSVYRGDFVNLDCRKGFCNERTAYLMRVPWVVIEAMVG